MLSVKKNDGYGYYLKLWGLTSARGRKDSIIQDHSKSSIQKTPHSPVSCPVMAIREIAFCSTIYKYTLSLSLYYLLVLYQAPHIYYFI